MEVASALPGAPLPDDMRLGMHGTSRSPANCSDDLRADLALLRRAPLQLGSTLGVRRARALLGLPGTQFRLRWVELRAGMMVVCESTAQRNCVEFVEAVGGASVVRKDATRIVVAPVMNGTKRIELRAGTQQEADKWLEALRTTSADAQLAPGDFTNISPLGKGGSGRVFLVRHNPSGEMMAMKVIPKYRALDSDKSIRHALDERYVLERVQGIPFLLQLRHAFQTEQNLYLITEFCSGGDLHSYLTRQEGYRMREHDARIMLAEVVYALQQLHERGVVYRDLKPENVLISNTGHVALADFGLSKVLPGGASGRTTSFCGTLEYIAPEVVRGDSYGMQIDLWALGVLAYRTLVGYVPFRQGGQTQAELFRKIEYDDVEFPKYVSAAARELITQLMRRPEEQRPSLRQVMAHEFFAGIDWNALPRSDLAWNAEFQHTTERTASANSLEKFDLSLLKDLSVGEAPIPETPKFRLPLMASMRRTGSRQSNLAGYSFSSLGSSTNLSGEF